MAKRGRPKQRLFMCQREIFINDTGLLFQPGEYARREDLGSYIPKHFVEVDPQSHAVIATFDGTKEDEVIKDADSEEVRALQEKNKELEEKLNTLLEGQKEKKKKPKKLEAAEQKKTEAAEQDVF